MAHTHKEPVEIVPWIYLLSLHIPVLILLSLVPGVLLPVPDAVTDLLVTSVTQTSLIVSWYQPGGISGITSYDLGVINTISPENSANVTLNCSSSGVSILHSIDIKQHQLEFEVFNLW